MVEGEMMQTVFQGRVYELSETEGAFPHLQNHLLERGFDGKAYKGVSKPVGRQRKTFQTLFFRSAKTGLFEVAL